MIGEPIETARGAYRHLTVEETSSTNTLCLEYALAGEPGDLWVTATDQTGGKGSRGRDWESKKGNLFASLLLTDPCSKNRLADLTFVAAISVQETIESFSHKQNKVQVKWPNDVMLNERKCSGILLESVHQKDTTYVVIGIGINCLHFPVQTLHPATSLFAEGVEVSANTLFFALAKKMADNISLWKNGNNFSAIRQKWLDNTYKLGEMISVHVPGQERQIGLFASVDDNGYMLLELPDGTTKQISTADIFFNKTG